MSHGIGQHIRAKIVEKRQRRLTDVDEVFALYARGLTTGEISAHFAPSTTRRVQDTVSRITDCVLER
ncbi:transposase, Mutator family protein [Mycobacterium ulcerans str. Harvey]|uniref:Transposase, Mutator family protein n=1 Tax=Mycobacterium ulcerans str. Harvey TaxID=1299332 RepID=A0ABN0QYZ8_MYCUL|nr:transposase, Mutator family protein [Mycobacterium ulcerans str. Harvey]